MPIGAASELPTIVFYLISKQPASVLDLGVGMGMYGAAVRQWLDMGYAESGKRTLLHGVEGFEKYKNPVWELYDRVLVADILEIEPERKYDAILLCDVLEHFTKEQGRELIAKAIEWLEVGGSFIITTPAIHCEQGEVYGNAFETHRCLWTPSEMSELGFQILNDGKMDRFGCLMLTAIYEKA